MSVLTSPLLDIASAGLEASPFSAIGNLLATMLGRYSAGIRPVAGPCWAAGSGQAGLGAARPSLGTRSVVSPPRLGRSAPRLRERELRRRSACAPPEDAVAVGGGLGGRRADQGLLLADLRRRWRPRPREALGLGRGLPASERRAHRCQCHGRQPWRGGVRRAGVPGPIGARRRANSLNALGRTSHRHTCAHGHAGE